LEDGSSRPTGQPRLTPRAIVSAILRHADLRQLRVLDPKPVVQRYEWPHAGDLRHRARSKPPARSEQTERFM
jgi:hypothetical protein